MTAAVTIVVSSVAAAALPAPSSRPITTPAYTAATAPDSTSRQILAASLKRLDEGSERLGGTRPAIHHNFPQIVEQNFARMDAGRLNRFLSNAQPAELSDLAQLYANAVSDRGRAPRLLDVFAARATPRQLGLLAEHFGYSAIHDAIARNAPEKGAGFREVANVSAVGPIAGQSRIGAAGRYVRAQTPAPKLADPYLDYTLYETYLSFRTAPIGSLGVGAAAFSTATLWGTNLTLAWTFGYSWVGSSLNWLMQNYAPRTYDNIGAAINWYVEALVNAPGAGERATAEETSADIFQLGPIGMMIEATGGDFGVAHDWYDYGDWGPYGGGGRICEYCSIP